MQKTPLLLLWPVICIFVSGCTKQGKPAAAGFSGVLPNLSISLSASMSSDSVVSLSWTANNLDTITSFMVVYTADTTHQYKSQVKATVDKSVTRFTDTLPATPYYTYYIVVKAGSTFLSSNKVTVTRTDLKFLPYTSIHALLDRDNQNLILFTPNGGLALYSLNSETITRSISTGMSSISGDLGYYNGSKAIYITNDSGFLVIYDAATLYQLSKISLGFGASQVVYNKGLLFFAGSSNSYMKYRVTSYNPVSLTAISSTDCNNMPFLLAIPGTQTRMFGFGGGYISLFTFDSVGNFISFKNGSNYNSYFWYICAVIPTGEEVVATISGLIYDTSLSNPAMLPDGAARNYTSFCFDSTNQLLYATNGSNSVQAYWVSNNQFSHAIQTKGRPVQVFCGYPWLVAICEASVTGSYPNNFFVQVLAP